MVCHCCFFFALFSLFRYVISIGFIERPLVVGLFWGVLTGDYTLSLYIAIFFELFWLDLIPVGTFIPPHLTAATFSALSLATFLGYETPSQMVFIFFASMPMAWFGAKMEGVIRDRERVNYNRLLNWARNPESDAIPTQIVARSAGRTFVVAWGLFYVSTLVLYFTFQFVAGLYPTLFTTIKISWPHLWIAASIGGLMALRLKQANIVLTTGITIIAVFVISGCF
ncbi:PTS sugar transporter subunit IIC [Pseudodesulfovibrio profundus]|uniref:PTS sugar transporter subunit IIC n=1 Tax=Pseudodesulfovibrio profundus TaxID=57320 RepID=UPI000BE283B9|nr:PTS sugar transporter subunit IIC [Pseudodesulfovibrio profundus]